MLSIQVVTNALVPLHDIRKGPIFSTESAMQSEKTVLPEILEKIRLQPRTSEYGIWIKNRQGGGGVQFHLVN